MRALIPCLPEYLLSFLNKLTNHRYSSVESFLKEETDYFNSTNIAVFSWLLLLDIQQISTSPYDLFYYNNSEEGISIPNCNEHVDPGTQIFYPLVIPTGFLTCVPVSKEPGLSIVDKSTGDLLPVEMYLHADRDVLVFADWTLQVASHGKFQVFLVPSPTF
jgi:hypothetical protein